jgi:hypothetical protein
LSKPKKKPATKVRPKEGAALSGRDQEKERSEQPDASTVAGAIFAKPSWHDPDRVSRVTLRFVELGAEDEAAVDRAIKLLDLIDRKTLDRENERAEEIKRLEEEANIRSHFDFRQGIIFITGTQRPDRAEANFIEYLLCKGVLTCPPDDVKEELLRLPDVATLDWLALKRRGGFSKHELLGHRSWFKLWTRLRPAVRKVRGPPSKFTRAEAAGS